MKYKNRFPQRTLDLQGLLDTMESDNREGGVTFIWAIENFDRLFKCRVDSPVFPSKSLDHTKWIISMYPKGKNNDGASIEVVLTRCCSNNEQDNSRIILDCEISIIKDDGSSLVSREVKNHGFITNHSWSTCQDFVSRDDVFEERKTDFISYNILRIRCRMWRRFYEWTLPELRWNHTKIERSFFVWQITSFSRLKLNKEKTIYLKKALSETPTLTYHFHLERTQGTAKVRITSGESTNIDLSSQISILDCKGTVHYYESAVAMNCENRGAQALRPQEWKFPTFTFDDKLEERDLYLPMDVLSLGIDCFFWAGNTVDENGSHIPIQNLQVCQHFFGARNCYSQRRVENIEIDLQRQSSDKHTMTEDIPIPQTCNKHSMTETENSELHPYKSSKIVSEERKGFANPDTHTLESFVHDMHCMFEEGLLSDFTLSAGKQDFPVHKSILSARSPVFKTMFTTPLKEKDGKVLDIPDIDGDSLHRMLLFVYSNKIDNLEWEDAINLYFAADKYNIEDLKNITCSILKSKLSVSNVCDILVHADLHEDQDLKSSAMEFITTHDDEIIGTEDWKKFQKKHIHLTMEILSVLYTKMKKRIE